MTHTHTGEFSTSTYTSVYSPNRLCTQMHHKRYQVCQCVSHCTTVKMNGTGFSYAYQLENWLKTLPTFLLQGEREASSILSRRLLAGAAPLYCPNIPPYQCFRGCRTPIRVMACKADLYSIIITKQLYTCINCTIVTLAEDRGWIRDYGALGSTPLHPLPIPKFWREH